MCDCRVEDTPIFLDEERQIRPILHFNSHNKLCWFAVIYYKMEGKVGKELYSVDTNHGFFHEHVYGHRKRNDRRDIMPLHTQLDVQESYDRAFDMVYNKHLLMTGG